MESSIEAAQPSGISQPKPTLAPKPRLTPKPFSLQKNTSIRSINAPKAFTETSKKTTQKTLPSPAKQAITPDPKPISVSELNTKNLPKPTTESKTSSHGEDGVDSSVGKSDPASQTAPPKETPKTEPIQKDDVIQTNHKTSSDVTPDLEQKISKSKEDGSQALVIKKPEDSGSNDSSAADQKYRLGSVRKRLPAELTSKFESGGSYPPPMPKVSISTTKGDIIKPESSDQDQNQTTPEPSNKESDEDGLKEDYSGGGSIKRRISQLFDSSLKPEVTAKREEPEIINSTGGVKERIKNWVTETNSENEKKPQFVPRSRSRSFEPPAAPAVEETPKVPPVEPPAPLTLSSETVDLSSKVSSAEKHKDTPTETPRGALTENKSLEDSVEASKENEQQKSNTSEVVLRNHSRSLSQTAADEGDSAASESPLRPLKRDKVKRRSVHFGTVERDDGGPPVPIGSDPDTSEEEGEAPKEENAEPISVSSRVGSFQKNDEAPREEEDRLKHVEFERRRRAEEHEQARIQNEEQKEREKEKAKQREEEERERRRQREVEERQKLKLLEEKEQERLRKLEEEESERLRLREEKEREQLRLREEEERERQRREELEKVRLKEEERERERLKEEEVEREMQRQREERERERQLEMMLQRQREVEKERARQEEERLKTDLEERERERVKEEERLREEWERQRKREEEMERERQVELQILQRQREEEREKAKQEEERLKHEWEERERMRLREEERLEKERERLREERERERHIEEEMERLKAERERLRQKEEEIERLKAERERERQREEEMERQKAERERQRQREEEMERLKAERERQRQREVEMERLKEERERQKQREEEIERLKEERERQRLREEEMERLKEERERLRQKEEEMERLKAEIERERLRLGEKRLMDENKECIEEEVRVEKKMEEEHEKELMWQRQKEEMERLRLRKEEEERERARQEAMERMREIEMERQIEEERREEERMRQKEKERREELERKQAQEVRERLRLEEERERTSRAGPDLISLGSEDNPLPSAKSSESPAEVVYDDFSVKQPQMDVDFDDFSVKPKRWGSQAKTDASPVIQKRWEDDSMEKREVEERVPMEVNRWDHKMPEQVEIPDSAEPMLGPRSPGTPEEAGSAGVQLISIKYVDEEKVMERRREEEVEETKETEDTEDRKEDTQEAQVTSYVTTDEDKDTDALIEDEPIQQEEACEQPSETDSPQPIPEGKDEEKEEDEPEVSPEVTDTTDLNKEEEPVPFPESSAPLLDTRLQRSKAVLSKRRTRSRPSRVFRAGLFTPESPDWRTCDSTDEKEVKQKDTEEDEEPRSKKISSSSPSSQRVPMFPGLSPSALLAQLKKRTGGTGGGGEEETEEDKGRQEMEIQKEEMAAPSPSQLSRSPRTASHMAGAARVLPPLGGADKGAVASPAWLKELKSKKRLSQHEGEA